MNIENTKLKDVKIMEPKIFRDHRGYFLAVNQGHDFVQDSFSVSRKGTLRGLHLQNPNPQGKLVMALSGQILDVVVDVRVGSPTFGEHVSVILDGDSHRQIWIPRGFAHGFLVLSKKAKVFYKCDAFYDPKSEISIRFNDPDINIDWGIGRPFPLLSRKDIQAPFLREVMDKLPRYEN